MTHVECIKIIVKLNLKKALLKSSLFDYSDDNYRSIKDGSCSRGREYYWGKKVIFKNCAEFTG